MPKKPLPLARAYQLIEPGPVVLLTTAHEGRINVMTMSWHTMLEFEPPLVGCVVSDRNHSFGLLRGSGECVISIPTDDLARAVVGCGNTSGAKGDKFRRYGLTPSAASRVAAPLIDEAYAGLECRVVDDGLVARYGMFVLEVLAAWVDPAVKNPRTLHHQGYGSFRVAGPAIRLRSRTK